MKVKVKDEDEDEDEDEAPTLLRANVDRCQWRAMCLIAFKALLLTMWRGVQGSWTSCAANSWPSFRAVFSKTQSDFVVDPRVLYRMCRQKWCMAQYDDLSGRVRVARLSHVHPRVAALSIRRTWRRSASSRGDPSERVRFSGQHDETLGRHEILDGWPTHPQLHHPSMDPSLQQNYATH